MSDGRMNMGNSGEFNIDLKRLASTGSTNADLAELARNGAPEGTVLAADHQSAGRGRFDRVWEAAPGKSVAISMLLRPPVEIALSWLPLVVGVGVCDGLRKLGADAVVKWPNDVLIDEHKVCGILVERVDTPTGYACIAGFGINTRLAATELPVPTATSLLLHGIDVTNDDVIATVLPAIALRYRQLVLGDLAFASLTQRYLELCDTIGRDVRVQLTETKSELGKAVGVTQAGCLQVQVAGELKEFAAGDVFHLRLSQ